MIKEFINDENVNKEATVRGLIKRCDISIASNNQKYLTITLTDKTGKLDCRKWQATQEDIDNVLAGKMVDLTGTLIKYKNSYQFKVTSYNFSNLNEIQIDDYIDSSRTSLSHMESELKTLIEKIHNKKIKELVETLIIKHKNKYFTYPAAMSVHHSYKGGLLYHSISVCKLSLLMASNYDYLPINKDYLIAGSLLHDIGKGAETESEANHAEIGGELVKRLGEDPRVINCVLAHHNDVEPSCIESVIVQVADAISAARPGARYESMEGYINRLENLEKIASGFEGVERAFAIQAGREVRVMVQPDKVDDIRMVKIAHDIREKIENELTYPGQIKVTLIREVRVQELAK